MAWNAGDASTTRQLATMLLSWSVAGVGDVDGDGMDDVVWRDAASGRNEIWRGADAASQIPLATVANPAWKIVAVDDFDYQGF